MTDLTIDTIEQQIAELRNVEAEIVVETVKSEDHIGLLMICEDGRWELMTRTGTRLMGPTAQKSSIKFQLRNNSNKAAREAGVTDFIEVETLSQARMIRQQFRNEGAAVVEQPAVSLAELADERDAIQQEFSVAERFQFMRNYVDMVSHQILPSAVICGGAGLGKTATVIKTVKKTGLIDLDELTPGSAITRRGFSHVKGKMTAKALFRKLYELRNGHVIIFDDCDSILQNDDAINILKAALDSYETRRVTWGAEIRGDDDLPRSFVFEGSVVIISNLGIQKIDDAILSRSQVASMQMTLSEVIDYMTTLVQTEEDFQPDYSMEEKMEVIDYLAEIAKNPKYRKCEINLRHLIIGLKQMRMFQDWKRMVLNKLLSESMTKK